MEFLDNHPWNMKINGGRCYQHSTKEAFECLDSTARTKANVRDTAKYFPVSTSLLEAFSRNFKIIITTFGGSFYDEHQQNDGVTNLVTLFLKIGWPLTKVR